MVFLLFLSLILDSFASTPQQQAQTHLRNAKTWYVLAKSTENDHEAFEHSERHYENAATLLKNATDEKSKIMLMQAQKGIEQSIYRLDNAHDSFRNAYWPVWWITGSDETAEWYDDVYMKALENVMVSLQTRLEVYEEMHQLPILVRAFRNPNLPSQLLDGGELEERLGGIRDDVMTGISSSNGVLDTPDEITAPYLPADFYTQKSFAPSSLDKVFQHLNSEELLLVDVQIEDELQGAHGDASIVRLSLHAQFLRKGENNPYASVRSQAVGQNLGANNLRAVFWFLGLFLSSLAIVFVRDWKLNKKERMPRKTLVGLGVLAFLFGMLLGGSAGQLSEEFLPDWGLASFFMEEDSLVLPYPPALMWPFIHGAVVMLGPLLALAWGSIKMSSLLKEYLPESITDIQVIEVIGPAAQAGSTTWMFLPLVMALPERGLWVALPLSLSAIGCCYVIATPLSKVLGGDSTDNNNLVSLGLGLFALSLIVPFGLFLESSGWVTALVVLLAGVAFYFSGSKTPAAQSELQDDVNLAAHFSDPRQGANLERPLLVEMLDFDVIHQELQDTKSSHLVCPERCGISRNINELTNVLHNKQMGFVHLTVPDIPEEERMPFDVIGKLLEKLGISYSDFAQREQQAQSAHSAVANVESIIGEFPGVGLLLGFVGEDDDEGVMIRSRVIRDAAKLLLQALTENDKRVIILEGVEYLDLSSRDTINTLLEIHNNQLAFIYTSTVPELGELQLPEQCTTHIIGHFTYEQAKEFVENCGIINMKDDLLSAIYQAPQEPGRVADIHQFLFLLKEHNLLVEAAQDSCWKVQDDFNANSLFHIIPKELQEIEQQRLKQFNEDERFLLDCASLCGKAFTISELAVASQWPTVRVAQLLHYIEEKSTPAVIIDTPDQDGQYRFVSVFTQEALKTGLAYKNKETYGEYARAIHRRVVDVGLSEGTISKTELLHHAVQAGEQYVGKARQVVLEVLEIYSNKRAWPDLLQLLNIKKIQDIFSKGCPSEVITRKNIFHAKALRFLGGRKNKLLAISLLVEQVKRVNASTEQQLAYELVYRWCETIYDGLNIDDLNELRRVCSSALEKPQHDIVKYLLQFYELLSKAILERAAVAEDMLALIGKTESLPIDAQQQLLLSMLLQTQANQQWKESQEKGPELWNEHVLPRLQRALRLKQEINDVQGQAMNLGITGSVYLFFFKDYKNAEKYLEEDYQLISKYGMDSDVPSVTNRLSMAYVGLNKTNEAINFANKAFAMSCELERKGDIAFASLQMLSVLQGSQLLAKDEYKSTLVTIKDKLCSVEFWQSIGNPYPRNQVKKLLQGDIALRWKDECLQVIQSIEDAASNLKK